MTWPLLDELRAFVAREEWQDDEEAVMAMEVEIASHTRVGLTIEQHPEELRWRVPENGLVPPVTITWTKKGAPFLRSRDAVALLEEALSRHLDVESSHFALSWWHQSDGDPVVFAEVFGLPEGDFVNVRAKTEPVARMLVALEAGYRLGVWPVKGG
jgi:hypothetical protein